MKRMKNPALLLALLVLVIFSSCELIQSRYRPLPPVIQLYNSALQRTLKLLPNDTLYVKVSGLAANTMYEVECLDPSGNIITMIIAESDSTGVIQPTALWYDIGFKWDATLNNGAGGIKLATEAELGLTAFEVHVKTLSSATAQGIKEAATTDFKLPFFVVYNSTIARPQPIVMAGKLENSVFNLENAFEAGNTLYVKVANMEDFVPDTDNTATLYIVPFTGTNYEDGSPINLEDDAYFSVEINSDNLDELTSTTGLMIPWDGNLGDPSIPTSEQGNAFSVILDVNNNQYFNVLQEGTTDYYIDGIDGNGVAGFIVREPLPPILTPIETVSLNLVSGGIFTYNYSTYQYDYDYRDSYRKDGADTKVATYYGVGPGVKVIWNPYAYYNGWDNDPTSGAGLYYGRYIDLYIIKSGGLVGGWSAQDLNDATNLIRKLTLPVQYGCANGLNQQTIWPAPMTPGDYALVLDMDGDGFISDGDIVDDVDRNDTVRMGTTNTTQRSGFSIRD